MLLHAGELIPVGERLPVNHVRLDMAMSETSNQTFVKPAHTALRKRYCGRHARKKVTFKKDLVSIREIPARENCSDSSDELSLSSSSEDSDDSSDSDCSSDVEVGSGGNLVDQISKLVLRHTQNKSVKPMQNLRSIPSRPPRLRRPRASATHQRKTEKITQHRNQPSHNYHDSRTSSAALTALPSVSAARLSQAHRPQSCTSDQMQKLKRRVHSPSVPRSTSAKPSLSLTNRSCLTGGSPTIYSMDKTLADPSNTNSGQERTKLYAWQVANGAPLVTTPGISPLYSEQVTLTRLK
ncbi:uncharacterized protein [Watersipora subatra]|uniref:uncharacterized protein n=1 Tax=Watersipora subatra TaxID=2589382 RepID=UPI00355AF6C2